MWKRPEEIQAHNQSQGRGEHYDPAQWIDTFVAEVETLWLEGDRVVLAGCCESVWLKREDVIAWRELPGREGRASTYEVRMKKGANAIAQRAVKASLEQPSCPRCGRSWDGLPPARGHDGDGGERDRGRGRGRECRDHGGHHHGHHEHGMQGHGHHAHGGPDHEHHEHGPGHHGDETHHAHEHEHHEGGHLWHHAHPHDHDGHEH